MNSAFIEYHIKIHTGAFAGRLMIVGIDLEYIEASPIIEHLKHKKYLPQDATVLDYTIEKRTIVLQSNSKD